MIDVTYKGMNEICTKWAIRFVDEDGILIHNEPKMKWTMTLYEMCNASCIRCWFDTN